VQLERAGIESSEASLDAELLARRVLGWDRARLISDRHEVVPEDFAGRFTPLVARRESREPVAYILGEREFWGLTFEVAPAVLIPRPETELIVEAVLGCLAGPGEAAPTVVDVGTGSGCLAVVVAIERPDARVVATDISAVALTIARRNALRHGVAGRITFLEADGVGTAASTADVVMSNPPYVPAGELETLAPEIVRHEPQLALGGGDDGLSVVRALIAQAHTALKPGGWFVCEFGFGQDGSIRRLVAESDRWRLDRIERDLQGIPRTLVAQRT
jgi:release factor glutamine methyltransferase